VIDRELGDLLRRLAPQVLAAVLRHHGDQGFADAEDAVQEALLAATAQWPAEGRPERPAAWLITVASRRMVDRFRSEVASRRREHEAAALVPPDEHLAPAADAGVDPRPGSGSGSGREDTLELLLLCCRPELSPASRIALTLRAVGGLTTAEVARAFLVPEATMAQRISRAKARLRQCGARFPAVDDAERTARLPDVLHVLYLVFTEGHTASGGPDLLRADLAGEAVRLARAVHAERPDDGEVTGLLALLLLTDARRGARTGPDGALVPLAEQDRSSWDRAAIDEGRALLAGALARHRLGPYQLQAAIAAVHADAERAEDTDWPQIAALYRLLADLDPGPTVALARAVAVGMADGPQAGLVLLAELDEQLAEHHRLHAVRGHLLALSGDGAAAGTAFATAARLTTSLPEQRYLRARAREHDT
jgi:RNA polymerase sigma factor (sigma-70 family)